MKYVIKTLAAIAIVCIAAVLLAIGVLGTAKISVFAGFDVDNCIFILEGVGAEIKFSLSQRFPIIVAWGVSVIAIMLLLICYTNRFLSLVKKTCRFVVDYAKTSWVMIKNSHVKYLLLIPTLVALYSSYMIPVMYDETLTYYDFVKPSFLYGLFFYPYPNNHVFLSLLTNITNALPIDLLVRLRLPSLLASLLTWILVYRFVKKHYSENVSLFITGLGMVVVNVFYYGFLARGYVFVNLFTVVCLYAAFNIVFDGNKRRDWMFFALGGILGAFSVPSFLYPFATISLFIFIKNYKHFKTQVFYSTLVGVGAILLYFPVLVVGGIEALASNGYVLPMARAKVLAALPGYFKGVAVNIFYLSPLVIALILLLVVVYVLYKRDKNTMILWALFCLAPPVLLLLHAVVPFFRVFNYYGFVLIFLIGIGLYGVLNKINKHVLLAALLVLQVSSLANFFMNKEVILLDASSSEEIVELLIEDGKKYCFHSGLETEHVEGDLKFESERRGINIETIKYWMTNADTAIEGYDYYLVLKEHDLTVESKPWKEMTGPFGKPINIYLGSLKMKED